ncbi:alpha/beta fold hydrolase [Streptomyces sp. NPDC057654]|uniref:alpha/beta fold hydrolase n=1 Tax=Streptomyces sp. NPDC057654 TaxID=3346196 RepID=UPI0036AC6AC1
MIRPVLRTKKATGPHSVLFVHGTMDHSAAFQQAAAHLPDWTVSGYDRRGWGASRQLADTRTALADHVADLIAVATRLRQPVLAGHSYGALTALAAAAQRPDLFRAVVAYEPPVPWLPWWPGTAPWEQLVHDTIPQGPAATARALRQAVLGRPAHGTGDAQLHPDGLALIREMTDPTLDKPCFDPSTLHTPVLTASGSRSLPHHQQTALHLAHLLPAGRHETVEGAGHIAHATHPQRFAELLAQTTTATPAR